MSLPSFGLVSPYGKLFCHAPNDTHLKTFGSLCYVSVLKPTIKKFQPRVAPGADAA